MQQAEQQVQATPVEFARLFSEQHRGLLSYRSNGKILIQRLGDGDFKPFRTKKADIPLDVWQRRKEAELKELPRWCFAVETLPSMEEMEEWVSDSVCETPTGHAVEPDGVGPDGVPSWLRLLGLI